MALLFVLPLAQMILTSFMSDKEINRFPPKFIPTSLHLDGYTDLFTQSHILRWLLNTIVVALIAIVAHLVLCSLAGYGFARLSFPGKNAGFILMLATVMIPTQLLMIPTYLMFAQLGFVDTLAAAFVPWLATAFGVFLMRQFFLSLPAELEEAAAIDGASTTQIFFRIVLPLARPALAALALLTLLSSWNDLIWPLVAISDERWYTLQVGLTMFQGTRRTQWSLLMAGNVVATLPLIIAFIVAQKRFIATMSFTGLKG
ncbi:carbohydrate ABC transporter permease [Micromonospora sp. SL1-18]|uniref:carbohydrate ABC transporter permease n=1 Tax=Micromonospora sp. SL1-18 TaxID=3399128 RepID=UPI003A4DFCD8